MILLLVDYERYKIRYDHDWESKFLGVRHFVVRGLEKWEVDKLK